MNDETEAYHLADIEECRGNIDYFNDHLYSMNRYRIKHLGLGIEIPKKRNESSNVGTECKCPICKRTFIKKTYQQKFCCIKCKNKYHNKRQRYY